MKPKYIITIPHSGSRSLIKMFKKHGIEHRFTHFEKVHEVAIARLLDEYEIITTYRDPLLVAASWVNRQIGGLHTPRNIRRWYSSWKRWNLFVEGGAQVFNMEDLTEHVNKDPHKKTSNLDIPYHTIDYAKEMSECVAKKK